jgi:hypothetical protein
MINVTLGVSISARLFRFAGWLVGVLACVGGRAEVIFDNTAANGTNFFRSSKEYGDEIVVKGGSRDVNLFLFRYFGEFSEGHHATATVRFYKNDGDDVEPGPKKILAPGSLLWESDPFPLITGFNDAVLGVPLVSVPNNFTWTVQFNGLSGDSGDGAGVVLSDPPSTGKSYDDFWLHDGEWTGKHFSEPTKANFFARISALPSFAKANIMIETGPDEVRRVNFTGVLQAASNPEGPYEDVHNAVSPYLPTDEFQQQYFRARR